MKLQIDINDSTKNFRVGRELHTIIGYANSEGRDFMYTTYSDNDEFEPLTFPCRWARIDCEWFLFDTTDDTILDILVDYFKGLK